MTETPPNRANGIQTSVRETVSGLMSQPVHLTGRRSCTPIPAAGEVARLVELCRAVLFPEFYGDCTTTRHGVGRLHCRLTELIGYNRADAFVGRLPELRRMLVSDAEATYRGDPAAETVDEVLCCYPGIKAITSHRIAHELSLLGADLVPRMISEMAHSATAIDIHPCATIGEAFTIDHGTGVVIGATAIIGRNVKIYQGVTLGAKSFDLDADGNPVKGVARHPIIGDNVVIYANSTILGRVTVGDGAVIGGNIWVTDNVAPGEKLVQAKANNILRFRQDEQH